MKPYQKILSILLSLVLLVSTFGCGQGSELAISPEALAKASYPGEYDPVERDAWEREVSFERKNTKGVADMRGFLEQSVQVFLRETDGKNRTYSPVSIYMALAMLAQLTDGETRGQILELLGSDSMDALRQQANKIWNANYSDSEDMTSILANSLWLNENVKFNQDTMDILAQDFYASSYRGTMGSAEFNKLLQSWINEQTGGLLKDAAGNLELKPHHILSLVSTVYFKSSWLKAFNVARTAPQTFHAPYRDVEKDFMHQSGADSYYWGEQFSAVTQNLLGGEMWFLLPDEGISPEKLLGDEEALDFLFTGDKADWEKQKRVIVHRSIPKFDVSAQFDLTEGLREMGVTDVFTTRKADFTPMTTDVKDPIALDQAKHAARVTIDEDGCEAAAFTSMAAGIGCAPGPKNEVDFVLDRPFIFCITAAKGLPLFMGIVNSPTE